MPVPNAATRAAANAAQIHYSARGSGEPLLLIHGLGSSGADWAFQIPSLAARFRVITPDLPGCGRSPALPDGPAIAEFARSLWTLLDDLQIGTANVAGFSLGGAVALEMALQRPGSVPRLGLINSLATYRIDHWRKWYEARMSAALVRGLGMRTMARLLAGRSFPETWQRPLRERAVAVIGSVPAADYLSMAAALEGWSAVDRLGTLRSKVLVIAAEHDFTPLAEKRALAESLGAQFVVARGSRHGTPFDAIELTNASLLALLTDEPLPDPARWLRDERPNERLWAQALDTATEHHGAVMPSPDRRPPRWFSRSVPTSPHCESRTAR
jgi:pimeloyl-ACP methyl ester carboxylesterase